MAGFLLQVIFVAGVIVLLGPLCAAENEEINHRQIDATNQEKESDDKRDSGVSVEELEIVSYEEIVGDEPNSNQTLMDHLTPPAEDASSYADFDRAAYKK